MNNSPIIYPNMPPRTEPIEQMVAKLNALPGLDMHKAISKISGGIGKNEDSQNASRKIAGLA